MTLWMELTLVWAAAACMMSAGWWYQLERRNAGIVDVLWAAGLAGAAVLLAFLGKGGLPPRVLLAILGGCWGMRLAAHLWHRVRREPEDGRYQHLRSHWQGSQWKFFLFFQFQALLIVLFCLPFAAVADNRATVLTPWLLGGIALWLFSAAGEAVADRQLARFRADPGNRGHTCKQGLWRYSRHPNYFFEWLHWFTYVSLAVGSPRVWLSVSGPVVMYVFLRWISGVPYTEAQALRTRGAEYRLYQQSTPMLFPWFPKDPAPLDTRKEA